MTTKSDFENYKKIALKASFGLIFVLLILALLTKTNIIFGILIGASLSCMNIFVLANSFYKFFIKKLGAGTLSSCVLFFLLLSSAGFYIVLNLPSLALGFALGLASPLIIGSAIALFERPAK